MLKIFIEPLLHIAVILPFLLCLKNRGRINNLRILSITFCYYIYSIALLLPKLFDVCNFINSRWNWDGKIFGIICCVLLYLIFRKLFGDNDFFTFKQSKDGLKPAALGAAIVVLISAVIWAILGNTQFNIESLLFQISLPGIDEELMFRGLILGLMCSSLRTIQSSFGNTAIILNAVLFGLMHALTLTLPLLQRSLPPTFCLLTNRRYARGKLLLQIKRAFARDHCVPKRLHRRPQRRRHVLLRLGVFELFGNRRRADVGTHLFVILRRRVRRN